MKRRNVKQYVCHTLALGAVCLLAGCGEIIGPGDSTAISGSEQDVSQSEVLSTPTIGAAVPTPEVVAGPVPTIAGNPEPTTTASGLQYIDIAEGEGTPAAAGSNVQVFYVGYLPSGEIFDQLRPDSGRDPFTLKLGQGSVIPGWEEGLQGMKPGGKRRLIIPPELGYGAQAIGSIPPNSTLIFDVDMVSVK